MGPEQHPCIFVHRPKSVKVIRNRFSGGADTRPLRPVWVPKTPSGASSGNSEAQFEALGQSRRCLAGILLTLGGEMAPSGQTSRGRSPQEWDFGLLRPPANTGDEGRRAQGKRSRYPWPAVRHRGEVGRCPPATCGSATRCSNGHTRQGYVAGDVRRE